MAEKKIMIEKVSEDAQGKQIKIGDTVYSLAKDYRSLVEAKVIDITPKTLLVEYLNNWNFPGNPKKERYRVGGDQIMLKVQDDMVEVVRCKDCDRRAKAADLTDTVLCRWLHDLVMPKDGFCSYGKKAKVEE